MRSSGLNLSGRTARGALGLALALGLVAPLALDLACGGGGGSTTVVQKVAPTLTGFSPASGVVGASVTLTGTALTETTRVVFGSVAAPAYSVLSDTQLRAQVPAGAISAPITVTTPGGSATSTASFTVSPSPSPTLASFSPASGPAGSSVTLAGTGFTGATAVTFGGVSAAFTVDSDTGITTLVPAGAPSGAIAVTTPGGTATSPTAFTVTATVSMDLTIDGLYLTQATQTYPATVSLVANRSAWVRVFVKANQVNTAQPRVLLTFQAGTTTHTLYLPAPVASVPMAINEADASQSWNAAVPAAWIQPGLTVLATVDPGGLIPEADKTNNQYPLSGTPQALAVASLSTWKVRFLPVTSGDGTTGAVDASNVASYADTARRIHPVPDALDAALGPAFTTSVASVTNDSTVWTTVLDEVTAKWNTDGQPATYFGVVGTSYSYGVAGIGWVGQAVAIGWDKPSSRAGVVAHEVGHTFGRLHAPCGNPSGVDPNYPATGDYVGGHIGVTGWDAFSSSPALKAAAQYTDIMGYCSPQWVSDYTYKGVLAYRQAHPQGLALPAATEGLLVWGHLEGDRMVLDPAIRVKAPAVRPAPGPFRWEARDAGGAVCLSADFQPAEVADAPGGPVRIFSFIVPLGDVPEADLQSVHVLEGGRELARAVRLAPLPLRAGAPEDAAQVTDEARGVALVWDAGKYPLLAVRDAATGELLGFQRGGAGRVRTDHRDLEILACDGVQTKVQRFQRRP